MQRRTHIVTVTQMIEMINKKRCTMIYVQYTELVERRYFWFLFFFLHWNSILFSIASILTFGLLSLTIKHTHNVNAFFPTFVTSGSRCNAAKKIILFLITSIKNKKTESTPLNTSYFNAFIFNSVDNSQLPAVETEYFPLKSTCCFTFPSFFSNTCNVSYSPTWKIPCIPFAWALSI